MEKDPINDYHYLKCSQDHVIKKLTKREAVELNCEMLLQI